MNNSHSGSGAINFSVTPTKLGHLLVATTPRGVSMVALGDDASGLVDDLRTAYPTADITSDPEVVRAWAEPIHRYLDGDQTHPEVPIDVPATTFQRRVWRALQNIPYGNTRTYGEVARMLDRPAASRAVARACASNVVALVVPCHRVLGKDGSLTGYRWGIHRKRALLDMEGSTRHARQSPQLSIFP